MSTSAEAKTCVKWDNLGRIGLDWLRYVAGKSQMAQHFCHIFLISWVRNIQVKHFCQLFFWYQMVCKGSTYQGGGIITSFMNRPLPQRCLHSRTFPNIGVRRFLPDRDRHRRNPWNRVHIHIGHSDNRKSHNLYWIRIEDGVKYSGAASNTASTNSACTVLVKVICT